MVTLVDIGEVEARAPFPATCNLVPVELLAAAASLSQSEDFAMVEVDQAEH